MCDGYRLVCPLAIEEKMAWPCWWVSLLNKRFTFKGHDDDIGDDVDEVGDDAGGSVH